MDSHPVTTQPRQNPLSTEDFNRADETPIPPRTFTLQNPSPTLWAEISWDTHLLVPLVDVEYWKDEGEWREDHPVIPATRFPSRLFPKELSIEVNEQWRQNGQKKSQNRDGSQYYACEGVWWKGYRDK